MPERDGYIPGVPCWADTGQPDPGAAASFYGELFGWELEDVLPPGAGPYFMGRIRGGDVAAITQPEQPGDPADWRTYIRVERADDAAERVRAAGGAVLTEPFDVGEAGRMAVFADPEGARFRVWEPKRHQGSRIVNEHGVGQLQHPPRARPRAGQALLSGGVRMGHARAGAGHVDVDPARLRRPSRSEHIRACGHRWPSVGAPPRFEDVVASMVPCQDGEAPHWSVTFAVDDADAIAQRAAELGGEVTVPPFDAPWVRTTVITDPQGASFMASKFVPENKDLLKAPAVSQAA